MDKINALKDNCLNGIAEIIEDNVIEIPDSLKDLIQNVSKIFDNWISSFSPDLPADQKKTFTNYIVELFKDSSVKVVDAAGLAEDLSDLGNETFDGFTRVYEQLNNKYEASQADVNKLTDRCKALQAVIDGKDKAIREAAISTQAALESTDAVKDAIIAAKDAAIAQAEASTQAALKSANAAKDAIIAAKDAEISISKKAIEMLNNKQDASTALLKNAGSVLGSRVNIVGIAFVALGAILLSAAYYYKNQGIFSQSPTHYPALNNVIYSFNNFMKEHHLGVARAAAFLMTLGTVCVISSKVAFAKEVQSHLARPESFWIASATR